MRMTQVLRSLAAALLLTCGWAGAAVPRNPRDFAGYWVFKLGERNFILLELTATGDDMGSLTGSLTRPLHFQATRGAAISRIELPVVRCPLVRSAIDGDLLRVVFGNPADAKDDDLDEFEFRLSESGKGSLGPAGATMDPWPFERVAGSVAIATDWVVDRTYRPDDSDIPNAEMTRVFDADQFDRKDPDKIDWAVVGKADAARREATRVLLDGGKLHAAGDFTNAAFVFQHGEEPGDFLLAHTLAMIAVAKGDGGALWIASATLDRYLRTIGKPQVYGTQYSHEPGGKVTQDPYDRTLISDALRRQLGVPSLAEQEAMRK